MSISDEQQAERDAYKKVVNIVYHNTTPKQPAMLPKRAIGVTASNSNMDAETVSEKLRLAVKNGDLITDGSGRYCVTDDKDRLRRAANAVAKQCPVDKQLLGKINKAIQEL
jgi:hypothetical protein